MTTPSITELLEGATKGDAASIREFFRAFLKTQYYVPTRRQNKPITRQAAYPTAFFSLLGLPGPDGNFIAAFTEQNFCEEWANDSLTLVQVSGKELCERTPDGWLIELNPGQESSKQFSAWEISQLRFGEAALEEIVAENLTGTLSDGVEVGPIEPSEFSERLRLALTQECTKFPEIIRATVATSIAPVDSPNRSQAIIVGLELTENVDPEVSKKHIAAALRPVVIGEGEVVVLSFSSTNLENADLFAGIEAWYIKKA